MHMNRDHPVSSSLDSQKEQYLPEQSIKLDPASISSTASSSIILRRSARLQDKQKLHSGISPVSSIKHTTPINPRRIYFNSRKRDKSRLLNEPSAHQKLIIINDFDIIQAREIIDQVVNGITDQIPVSSSSTSSGYKNITLKGQPFVNSNMSNEDEKGQPSLAFTDTQFQTLIERLISTQVSQFQSNLNNTQPVKTTGNFAFCKHRFNGINENYVDAFINAVKIYKDTTQMTDENALLGFPLLLEDEAAIWWQGVKTSVTTFDDALDLLRSTFSIVKPPYLIYKEIFASVQGENEKIDLFINKIRYLFSKLPSGELNEKIHLDMCYGLLSLKLRNQIKRDDFSSFDKLLTLARAEECFFLEKSSIRSANHNSFVKQVPKVEKSAPTSSTIDKIKHYFCVYCKSREHNIETCEKKKKKTDSSSTRVTNLSNFRNSSQTTTNDGIKNELKCFICGKPGFVRSNCPDCKAASTSQASVDVNLKSPPFDVPFSSVDLKDSSKFFSRPVFNIKILGVDGSALVDTAAKLSVASNSLHKVLLHYNVPFEVVEMKIKLADGSVKEKSVQTCTLDVHINGRTVKTRFVVFPNTTETLLGIEFLVQAGILLDFLNHQWKFSDGDQLFPLEYEKCGKVNRDSVVQNNNDNPQISESENTTVKSQCVTPPQTNNFHNDVDVFESDSFEFSEDDMIPLYSFSSSSSDICLRPEEGNHLTPEMRTSVEELLNQWSGIFEAGGEPTSFVEHHIDTGDHRPISVPPYPMSPQKRIILRDELDKMLRDDIIEECESPWSAPVVLIQKPDLSYRFCVDYRGLNSVTVSDKYPMPKIDDLLHLSKRTLYMTTIDLRSGYWQISVKESDRDKTAFVCVFGLFRFKRMPFGVKNGPSTFQRLVDRFKAGISQVTMLAYLDDMIVISESYDQHLKDLNTVFAQLQKFGLRANRKKCNFFRDSISFLGHVITPEGIIPNLSKVSAISNIVAPRNVRHLKTFLQTCSWYRKFVPDFANKSKILNDLTKKTAQWTWTVDHQRSFERLKDALVNFPILQQADPAKPFILRTDASSYALGAVLLQLFDNDEKPVEYASRLLIPAERNYSTTEREALAVIWALKRFQGYLDGAEVLVGTDHQPLKWLMSLKSPTGRLARWALYVQGFNLKIEYVPGKMNLIADTLSRPPCQNESECGICSIQVDLPVARMANIRENQTSDPEIMKIITAFETPDHPNLRNWIDRGYVMNAGVLYRYVPDSDTEEPQLIIPEMNRLEVLQSFHNSPTGGHYGIDRTYHKILKRYFWPGMRSQVSSYVKNCIECQKYKPSNLKPAGLLRTPVLNQRFEVLAVDLFGPLVETSDGYRWILIVEDTSTRWVELFPLISATAEICSKILIDEVFLRFGIPRRIVSDNGPQFISAVMQKVAHCLGIEQSLNPVYHPESNPVERRNRDLKTQLAILVENHHDSWSQFLPAIRFAMNTTDCESTGFTPAYFCFGTELRHVFDVTHDFRTIVENSNFVPEISPYLSKLGDTIHKARDTHEKKQDQRKRYVDEHRRDQSFAVNDLVLVKTHTLSNASQGRTSKFTPRRDGPYRIVSKKSPTTYVVESLQGKPIGTYHVSMLYPYRGSDDVSPVNPHGGRARRINDSDPTNADTSLSSSDETDDEDDESVRMTRRQRVIQKPLRYRD